MEDSRKEVAAWKQGVGETLRGPKNDWDLQDNDEKKAIGLK